jgi:hypothetical protein
MIAFVSKSLVSLAVVAALWGPAESWLGTQQRAGLACRSDFTACRVAGRVIPLVDRSSVLGRIAADAGADPVGQLQVELRRVAMVALNGVRAAAEAKK